MKKASSALTAIRGATARLHNDLERAVGLSSFLRLPIDQTRYRRLLTTHLQLHHHIAIIVKNIGDQNPLINWSNTAQLNALRSDLRKLGSQTDSRPSELYPQETRAGALGWIYVIEGASHGNLQLLRSLRKDEALNQLDAFCYLSLSADRLTHNWPGVLEAISRLSTKETDDAVSGAVRGFKKFGEFWETRARIQ